jgi:hypothetical protein
LNHGQNFNRHISGGAATKLVAIAALKGKSMKDYLLEGKIDLGADDQEKALVALEALLDSRSGHHPPAP